MLSMECQRRKHDTSLSLDEEEHLDIDNLVNEFKIDDSISACFADIVDDGAKTKDKVSYLPITLLTLTFSLWVQYRKSTSIPEILKTLTESIKKCAFINRIFVLISWFVCFSQIFMFFFQKFLRKLVLHLPTSVIHSG